MNNLLPKARTSDIIEQEAGSELLIYDLRTNKMLQLNKTSKIVYRACGKVSFDNLKQNHKFTDDLIHFALDELKANDLLESETANQFAGLTRREVIRRVGLASVIALPVISTMIAPVAANAASFAAGSRTRNQTCNTSPDCATSAPNCNNLRTGARVCCAGFPGSIEDGGTYIGIYSNCNSCASTYAPEFCCSGQNRNTGCTTNGNGTGNCQYQCF